MSRIDVRVKTELPVKVFFPKTNTFKDTRIIELSLNGALVEDISAELHDIISIRVAFPKAFEVELFGKVSRLFGDRAAVQFYQPDRDTISTLWNFIRGVLWHQKEECPYCNIRIEPGEDHCRKCGWYLNFEDAAYLDKHMRETFMPRLMSRVQGIESPEHMLKIINIIDSETLKTKSLSTDIEFVGTCKEMLDVFSMIRKVATTDMNVLVLGESGTGKELTARAIHERSQRKKKPFITVNSAAIPEGLLEAELFGYEKGSFTGAFNSRKGKFETADGGTVFLDEIGDLSERLQAKILRFLEDRVVERVGARGGRKVDVRIIAATNRDLEGEAKGGHFRKDLFFRLNAFTLKLPPLRDRGEDKVIIAKYLLRKIANQEASPVKGFAEEALHAVNLYEWPGNVRELINRVRRAIVMTTGKYVTAEDMELPQHADAGSRSLKSSVSRTEREQVMNALSECDFVVARAARVLGISRPSLYALIKKYSIEPPKRGRGGA